MKKRYLSFALIPLVAPVGLVVSCGSNNTSTNNNYLNETKELKSIFENEISALTPLGTTIEVSSFINMSSWKSFDDLFSSNYLGKYFTISQTFKQSFKDKNIYSKLKKITIQPEVNSKTLTVIFYLGQTTNDSNVVSKKVDNALTNIFNYSNQITIASNFTPIKYETQKEFDVDWGLVNKKVEDINYDILKKLLTNAFGFSQADLTKIIDNYKNDYFKLVKYSSTQITLTLTSKAISTGYIFFKNIDNAQKYLTTITSLSLIK